MTRAEYVSRISSLTQELTGLAAEYFSTQRDPYEVAGERFNQTVDAFEQDLSTRTAELEARAAAASAAVDAVTREQEQTQARLVKAIQQGDAAAGKRRLHQDYVVRRSCVRAEDEGRGRHVLSLHAASPGASG